MVTIDKMTMTVNVAGGAEAGRQTFDRMFDRAMERWWRQHCADEARSRRTRSDSMIGGRT